VTACSFCGPIPDSVTAYYNDSGEKLPPQVSLLKRHKVPHVDDFLECPECGALFLSEDDTASTGSGDYDAWVLTRLSAESTAVLHEILNRAGRAPEDPAGLTGRLLRLSGDVLSVAGTHLWERDRELARRLLPPLVEHCAAHGDRGLLLPFTTTPEDAALLLGELDRYPATPYFDRLRALARVTVCSICRSIPTYPPMKIRLDVLPPVLRALRRFGVSAHTDVWECPECGSLHFWESEDGIDGGLSRFGGVSIRPYLHRPDTVDAKAIDSLLRSGGSSERLAITLGMRRDPELVRSWAPNMVFRLAREPEWRWLHDALCELARDPATAASILKWIAKLERTNARVDSLAARARGN
jgi:hypothetical protein